jgi:hypothetical protein
MAALTQRRFGRRRHERRGFWFCLRILVTIALGVAWPARPAAAGASEVWAGANLPVREKRGFGLEVVPARLEVVLGKAGEEKKVELTYINHTDQRLNLEIFPIDFKQGYEGAMTFLNQQAGSYSYSLASFLSLESDRLDLEPGKQRVFSVKVKNRQDLSPGGHYAAVVAKLSQAQGEGEKMAQIAPSMAALIFLRKTGGERFNLSLKSVDWPQRLVVFSYPRHLNLLFQNEGNVHLFPYGRFEIRDFAGRLLYKAVVNTSSLAVFPESRRRIKVYPKIVQKSLPVSLNKISVKGEDSLKKTNYVYQETFIYLNPLLISGGGGVGLFLLMLVRRRR